MSPVEDTPPSFELAAPPTSEDDERMRGRVAARLFGETEPQAQPIAHYELGRRIGAGGMGVVHVARDVRLDRRVALKLLRRNRSSERTRLIAEARTLAKLSHPHVVQVYEVGEYEGGVFVAMELIEGRDLHHWQRVEQPGFAHVLDAYQQAGLGLAAAHALGIVHFDFKATNLLRGSEGRVRVADFGLAEQVAVDETPPEQPRPGDSRSRVRVMGTPGYMAPEVARGDQADARADQFSFCATLWEAITGQLPFPPGVGFGPTTHPSGSLSPRWLRAILLRGLSEDPSRRWPSIDALLVALHERPRRRRRAVLGLALLVVVTGAGLGVRALLPAACEAGTLTTIWTDARRTALVERGGAARYVAAQIDGYASRWQAARASACEEAPEQRAAMLACLDRGAQRVEQLVALVEREPRKVDEHLDELLGLLGDPATCRGEQRVEAPPELAAEVAQLRERIDAARLALVAGNIASVIDEARAIVTRTENHRFAPLEAEARILLGEVLLARGDAEAAIAEHRSAARLAETSHEGALLFDARLLAARSAIAAEQPSLAREWLADAETSLELLHRPTARERELLLVRALWLMGKGPQRDFDAAVDTCRRALHLVAPHDAASRRRIQQQLANALSLAKRFDEARPIYVELEREVVEELGEDAHLLGVIDYNLGLLEYETNDLDAAKPLLERAHAIQRIRVGDDAPRLGEIDLSLATLALALDQPDRAWVHIEHAKPLLGPRLPAELLELEAMAALTLRRYEHALRIYETPALRAEARDDFAINRAWLRCRVVRCQGIEGLGAQEAILAGEMGDYLRVVLANREIEEGRPREGMVWIADIVARAKARGEAVDDVEAEALWLAGLAGASWASHHGPTELLKPNESRTQARKQ